MPRIERVDSGVLSITSSIAQIQVNRTVKRYGLEQTHNPVGRRKKNGGRPQSKVKISLRLLVIVYTTIFKTIF